MIDDLTDTEAKILRLDNGLRFRCVVCNEIWLVAQRNNKTFPQGYDICHNGCAPSKKPKSQPTMRKRTQRHKGLLNEQTKRIQDTEKNALFINQCWPSIAADAWEGYLNHGRGILCVTPHKNDSATYDNTYITCFKPLDNAELILACLLQNYDPEIIVLMIIERDGREYIHHPIVQPHAEETRLRPPDAYQLLRG